MSFSQVIAEKKQDIIQAWMGQVRGDDEITSSQHLTYAAILDSLPSLIDAIAHLLSNPTTEDINDVLATGLKHGKERAHQGYDAEEIVREYAILRDVIFNAIEDELLKSDALLLIRATRLIDGAIDKIVATCLKRYTEERLRDVNLLYDEMVASNEELDRLLRNEQKNLAHLAHELKSPLSCIIGYSDLFLRQQKKSGEVNADFVERVLSSGRKLLEMINDSLEISFYRAGKVSITPELVSVCELVEEVATVLDTLARQKGLDMVITCMPVNRPVVTDKNRLRQVVTNLISNAIRYTEEGQITVKVQTVQLEQAVAVDDQISEKSLTHDASTGSTSTFSNSALSVAARPTAALPHRPADGSHPVPGNQPLGLGEHNLETETPASSLSIDEVVEIEVTDTGLGIDIAEQSKIFEPYYQGSAGQSLQSSTGLGLAIVQQTVKLLQGSIRLRSKPNAGSSFIVTLPFQLQLESEVA